MPDWKEMYLSLMRDTEKAIRILEEGQRKCEELYLADPGPVLRVLPEAPECRGSRRKRSPCEKVHKKNAVSPGETLPRKSPPAVDGPRKNHL